MTKKELEALIDNQLLTIKQLLSVYAHSAIPEKDGRQAKVEIYQEANYCYSLKINNKLILTSIGAENFSHALGGFIRGLCFAWEE